MPINPDAVGLVGEPVEFSWTSKDCLLYALGVGAGAIDPTGFELEFTTENSRGVQQRVLPTYGVIACGTGGVMGLIGEFDFTMLVHGGQGITLHSEIPVEGTVRNTGRVAAIWDKGNAVVVVLEAESVDVATGKPLITARSSMFIRGEGGWGGDRGPSSGNSVPGDREPDHVVTYSTRPDQALLYRLSGDRNPLHSDPEIARIAGFPAPIGHGLCTYGFTGRALLHTLCDSDPAKFGSMDARFSNPVTPGDDLTVKMWDLGGGSFAFRTEANGDRVVIDAGTFERS
ncbi:MAG: MaoC/PaaZ C-terminal domain-containing protein [Acidimicrobiia bacterium]